MFAEKLEGQKRIGIVKISSSLIFKQSFDGIITVFIMKPYIEGIVENENTFTKLESFEPEDITLEVIYNCVEELVKEERNFYNTHRKGGSILGIVSV